MLKKIINKHFNEGCLPIIFLKCKITKNDNNWNESKLLPMSTKYYNTDLLRTSPFYKNIAPNFSNSTIDEKPNKIEE